MDDQFIDEALPPPQSSGHRHTLLVASLLHLMSHYIARSQKEEPCLKLAAVIERHLTALSRSSGVDPLLRATCEQLSEKWGDLVEVKLPRPAKRNFFARLISIDRKSNEQLPLQGKYQ